MKKNLLGEVDPKGATYNAYGKKKSATGAESRLIRQEA
jgi:hypothetical protein